jgi:DNA polymerase
VPERDDETEPEPGAFDPAAWRILREVRQRLESLQRAGVRDLPRPTAIRPIARDLEPPMSAKPPSPPVQVKEQVPPRPPPPEPAQPARTSMPKPRPAAAAPPAASLFEDPGFDTEPVPVEERPALLKALAAEVAACTKCSELARCRTQTVFADGSPTARLLFIGEAPGADEDRQGVPFVGRAGQLLTYMITKGMGLKRQDVYIANILKCRPPENRSPSIEESANCLPYLKRQIEIVRPGFICLLGLTAAQGILGTSLSMGRLRGKWYRYQGIPTIVTYHPAYLLRNPASKKEAWEDLQVLMNAMGIPIPGRAKSQG